MLPAAGQSVMVQIRFAAFARDKKQKQTPEN
jgi:hypothetical protein